MLNRRNSVARATALFLLACVLGGCTNETVDGDTSVFTFALWVPGLVLLGGIVALLLGLLLRQKTRLWGWILIVVGPLVSFVLGPNLFLDKATVNKDRFTLRTGFWFAPTRHEVHFTDLSRIELIAEERMTRRGRSTSYYLLCCRKSGADEKVPIGDLMRNGPADKILLMAQLRGIPIIDKQ